jgi:hypothetical protein
VQNELRFYIGFDLAFRGKFLANFGKVQDVEEFVQGVEFEKTINCSV